MDLTVSFSSGLLTNLLLLFDILQTAMVGHTLPNCPQLCTGLHLQTVYLQCGTLTNIYSVWCAF